MRISFVKSLFHNFPYKIFSLLLALIVWSIIQSDEIVELNRQVNVRIRVPDGYALKGEADHLKDATLSAPRLLISNIPEVLNAEVALKPGPGKRNVRLTREKIDGLDERVKITIHDPYMRTFMDKKAKKKVFIKEVLTGSPAKGYTVKKVSLSPSSVTLVGLKNELLLINEVITDPIDITGIQTNKSLEAKLVLPSDAVKSMSVETTVVSLQVGDSKINKRFGDILVEIVDGDYKAKVTPGYISIVIQSTPGTLSFVKRSDLKAFVDIRDFGPGEYEQEVKVKIPGDTALIETFPEKVKIQVSKTKKTK